MLCAATEISEFYALTVEMAPMRKCLRPICGGKAYLQHLLATTQYTINMVMSADLNEFNKLIRHALHLFVSAARS